MAQRHIGLNLVQTYTNKGHCVKRKCLETHMPCVHFRLCPHINRYKQSLWWMTGNVHVSSNRCAHISSPLQLSLQHQTASDSCLEHIMDNIDEELKCQVLQVLTNKTKNNCSLFPFLAILSKMLYIHQSNLHE